MNYGRAAQLGEIGGDHGTMSTSNKRYDDPRFVSIWADFLRDWMSLMALVVRKLVSFVDRFINGQPYKAVFALIVFAIFSGLFNIG